jgi:hypothetical protein
MRSPESSSLRLIPNQKKMYYFTGLWNCHLQYLLSRLCGRNRGITCLERHFLNTLQNRPNGLYSNADSGTERKALGWTKAPSQSFRSWCTACHRKRYFWTLQPHFELIKLILLRRNVAGGLTLDLASIQLRYRTIESAASKRKFCDTPTALRCIFYL